MTRRSQRSLDPVRAAALLRQIEDFTYEVRRWLGQLPIGSRAALALSFLLAVLLLAGDAVRGEADARGERPTADT